MNTDHKKIKEARKVLLEAFAKSPGNFALTGGTALELYYLNHRFSADLDFFSPAYKISQIEAIVSGFKKYTRCGVKLENELIAPDRARVRFYSASFKSLDRPLKLDFVEDVIFEKPVIKKFGDVPVYSIDNIYSQKITAITGTWARQDGLGREIIEGRHEARDAFDIYMLSKNIEPLHQFLKRVSGLMQRGMVHWYRTFSREDIKLGLLDLDIYIKDFDGRQMIIYLEDEIKKFIKEVLGE